MPELSEKEAWKKYQDYCFDQRKKAVPKSKEARYYEQEIIKCQARLSLLYYHYCLGVLRNSRSFENQMAMEDEDSDV